MKLVITGASGRLGSILTDHAHARGWKVMSLGRGDLELADPHHFDTLFPPEFDALVHCAAWTDVDACEGDSERAMNLNGSSVGVLAALTRQRRARLIYVSTDYVYSGKASGAYLADESPDPLCVYGMSKALGERLALEAHPEGTQVVRTAWLYGRPGTGFIETLGSRLQSGESVRVIQDSVGQPTWAEDLADRLVEMLERDVVPGIYHGTNSGEASWLELAGKIATTLGCDSSLLVPITSSELGRPAQRPSRVILDPTSWNALGLSAMRPWQEALDDYLAREARR